MRNCADATVRIGSWNILEALRARSREAPRDLFISSTAGNDGRLAARDGVVVVLPHRPTVILVALFAGRLLSPAELIAALFGDDPAGGPERADQALCQAVMQARAAGAALGIVISTLVGQGYRARLVEQKLAGDAA